ncbi:polysaccharide pyruvyl transferase family protein [Aestuariicella hydrocarbonica]|uniref:Polysaccharide pyruvyl transferase family protein n=1 Tax=Pseudomaricurvus hydrocarbonicus TaxID=1470433 RepID=A0A9E5MGT2_9GAMM|nr:polysaccharide pyruvyl transferase family protein [Aestuariicella hydrocarbonica]NHO65106.1 polysaccharide pyruvyl transferase family protein [Aestuariicella hydrocarbonica]
MANVIINSTAVRNNGDIALITALEDMLLAQGHSVLIATPHPDQLREFQHRSNICGEVLGYKKSIFRLPLLADIAALVCLLSSSAYRKADILIGAPGGYINSYYGFTWRSAIYRWASRLGKKTAIYAQSVGPLNSQDQEGLAKLSKNINLIMVRDKWSKDNAINAGYPAEKILPSIDAIFLTPPSPTNSKSSKKVIGISVRQWHHDQRDEETYINIICHLSEIALNKGYSIEFISTCQGIPNYIDDSRLACKIAGIVIKKTGKGSLITINTEAHSLEELKERVSTYRCILGTRLHMCLISLLHGVPAFNISYEQKGKECYKYMTLDNYSIDYNEPLKEAQNKFSSFLAEEHKIKKILPGILAHQHQRALQDFKEFMIRLN